MYQVLALAAGSTLFALGPVWLLVRGGPLRRYAFELAAVMAPALIVLAISVFGYRVPLRLTAIDTVALPLIGLAISVSILVTSRNQLFGLLQFERRRLLWSFAAGVAAAASFVVYNQGKVGYELVYLNNGEYFNY